VASIPSSSLIGVFKGMGDLVCAAPAIMAELERENPVHVLLFPGSALIEFAKLIDFSPYQANLYFHHIPTGASVKQWKQFLSEMRSIQPEVVWISAHAPVGDSSWKIPLTLRMTQFLFWRKARLVGADSERLSWLFQHRLHVDRSLPLQEREWSAYRLFRGSDLPKHPKTVPFVPDIANLRRSAPLYDLVIHPGANAYNRKWPNERYGSLVCALPRDWRIAVVGLPGDISEVKRSMPADRAISYVSGTIHDSIETLASARMVLVMDSGNMHFARVLGVPFLAVFGPTDPTRVIDPDGDGDTLYEQKFPCQPCMRAQCSQPEVYCMTSVEPVVVATRLIARWDKLQDPNVFSILAKSE
jgi:ADP-heptose:LPS heptosyltransferase